jgi:hypothetical protein
VSDARSRPLSTLTRPRSRHCEQNWHSFPAPDGSHGIGIPISEAAFCSPRCRCVVQPSPRLQGRADWIGDRDARPVHCTQGAWEDMVPCTPSRAGAQVPPLPLPITLNLHQRGAPGLVSRRLFCLLPLLLLFRASPLPSCFSPLSTPHQHLRFTRLAFLSSSPPASTESASCGLQRHAQIQRREALLSFPPASRSACFHPAIALGTHPCHARRQLL